MQAPSTPQGIALRARIVLLAGEGIANHANLHPKPFIWTKTAEEIIAKVNRDKAILKTVH